MSLTVDIVLVLVVLLGFLIGWVRGFVRSVAKPVKIVFSGFFAYVLCSKIGPAFLQPIFEEPLVNQLTDYLTEKTEVLNQGSLPTLLKFAASICNVDLSAYEGATSAETAANLAGALAEPLARILSIVLAFIGVYLVSAILISLILKLIDFALRKSPVSVINRALGFLVSGVLGVILSWIVCSLFTWVISLPAVASQEWAANFEGGAVYRFFRSFDPLSILLSF